jgi:hypothetical protein
VILSPPLFLPETGIPACASFSVHAFMPFPVGSSILGPLFSKHRDGSGYVRDRSFQTFVVTISSSPLCQITAFSVLRGVLLSRLLGVRQFDVSVWSVAAPRSVSEILSPPLLLPEAGILACASFFCACVLAFSCWIFDPSSFSLQILRWVRVCVGSAVSHLCRYDYRPLSV